MAGQFQLSTRIPDELAGLRLDQALSRMLGEFSRARIQQWIKDGQVLVNGQQNKPRERVRGGEQVDVLAHLEQQQVHQPEELPLDIIYQDPSLLIVNKPAGLVVHPAAGNWHGTLQNGLLFQFPELEDVPRAGIVHRLDKDTTGLLVVARTPQAHHALVKQLQARSVRREYDAVVFGSMVSGGTVDQPIGRHPVDRKRMAVVADGKTAITHYRVVERFKSFSWLRVRLETGRTHQIRVHMAHIHYPLVGDPVYAGRRQFSPAMAPALRERLQNLGRQALHARLLQLIHPQTGKTVHWEAALPADMQSLIDALQTEKKVSDGESP